MGTPAEAPQRRMSVRQAAIEYIIDVWDRLPAYLFPFLLALIEWVLRSLKALGTGDAIGFIGPTFAAAGIGLVLPLTWYLPRVGTLLDMCSTIDGRRIEVVAQSVRVLRGTAWIAIIFLTSLWICSIVLQTPIAKSTWSQLPTHAVAGILGYAVACFFQR